MRCLAVAAVFLAAACGSGLPEPVATGPRLRAEKVASFREAQAPGRQAAFSADGQWLATSSASGLVVLRRMPDLKMVRRLQHRGGAAAVAFAPDRKSLATSGYDGAVRLWDVGTGRLVRELRGAQGTVWTLDYSPDGRQLAAAGEDGLVRIWSPADRRLLRTLTGHARNVWEVGFSPDGRWLVTSGDDGAVTLWRLRVGTA